MKSKISLILVFLFIGGCNDKELPRPQAPDPVAVNRLSGFLFYINEYDQDSLRSYSLPYSKVYLQYGSNSGSDIRDSATTNTFGYYVFSISSPDTIFNVHARYVLDRYGKSFLFKGSRQITSVDSSGDLTLRFDEDTQHGLYIYTFDSLGGTVSNADVNIYGSRILAESDTNYSGTNAIMKFKTDGSGRYLANGLPVGQLFVTGLIIINNTARLKCGPTATTLNSNKTNKVYLELR